MYPGNWVALPAFQSFLRSSATRFDIASNMTDEQQPGTRAWVKEHAVLLVCATAGVALLIGVAHWIYRSRKARDIAPKEADRVAAMEAGMGARRKSIARFLKKYLGSHVSSFVLMDPADVDKIAANNNFVASCMSPKSVPKPPSNRASNPAPMAMPAAPGPGIPRRRSSGVTRKMEENL